MRWLLFLSIKYGIHCLAVGVFIGKHDEDVYGQGQPRRLTAQLEGIGCPLIVNKFDF